MANETPESTSKWVDLFSNLSNVIAIALAKGVIPIFLLGLGLWWMGQQQARWDKQLEAVRTRNDKQLEFFRADLIAARAETSKAFDRCLERGDKQASEIKATVKEVRNEVTATKEAVNAVAPAPPPAPNPR